MVKKKRWGKKHKDKRNWKVYNRQLVLRGVFYIKPEFLNTWLDEINEMNAGKVGQPYLYPNSMIEFLAVLSPKFDVRTLEGIMEGISEAYHNFPIISYSQISHRINALNIDFPVKENPNIMFEESEVGTDASGIKVTNRGEWIRHKWKVQRGWIKVVVMGNRKGRVVDVRVGVEDELNENEASREMLKIHHKTISKFFGDGGLDAKENFHLIRELQIKSAIKIDKNASNNFNGCMERWKYSQEQKKLGYKKWAKKYGYGYRWVCTEGIYSAVKRMEGEYVRCTKKENMLHEAKMKFWIYEKIRKFDERYTSLSDNYITN